MEVKPKTIESTKKATNFEDEKKKTNQDDMIMTTFNDQDQKITLIKGHLKIFQGLRQSKKTKDDQSSYVMKIKMGNYKNLIQRSSEDTKKMEQHHHQDHKNKKEEMNLKQNTEETTTTTNLQKMMTKKKVWDCESTLYDSFELNSFNRQLDSAISSSARSMSMPHVSFSLPPPPPSETTSSSKTKKQYSSNKISRSLQKLIKSMFRHNNNKQSGSDSSSSCASFKSSHSKAVDMDKYYVVFDKTGSLTTIPESGETTTEMGGSGSGSGSDSDTKYSLARKTVSERFPPRRLTGITCS